jgi:hypothetical protein
MRYAWKVSRLRHLIFDTDNPIVLGGRAMALHPQTGGGGSRADLL